jgi:ABC-type amino acid transport substrate-binding protein
MTANELQNPAYSRKPAPSGGGCNGFFSTGFSLFLNNAVILLKLLSAIVKEKPASALRTMKIVMLFNAASGMHSASRSDFYRRTFTVLSALCLVFLLNAKAVASEVVKTVRLATTEWPPYISEELPQYGYVYQLATRVFEHAGYRVEIDFLPWARALKMTEDGQYDGLFPEYYSTDRLSMIAFSEPFPGGPVGLYKRRDRDISYPVDPRKNQTLALKGLANYTFGVVRGYINTREFDTASFLQKSQAVDDEQNIRMLQAGRLDLIFIDKYVAEYLLKAHFPHFGNTLEFMNPPLEVKSLYIAFSKKKPNLNRTLEDFNRSLAKMQEDGSLSALFQEFGFGPILP